MSLQFRSKKRIILLLVAKQRLSPRTLSPGYLKIKTRRSTHPPSNRGPVLLKQISLNNRNNQAASLSSAHSNSRRMSLVRQPRKEVNLKMRPPLLRRNSRNLPLVMRLNSRQSLRSTRKSRVSGVSKMSRSLRKRSPVTIISEMRSNSKTTSIIRPSRTCATALLLVVPLLKT